MPSSPIRLLAVDIDGTLTDPQFRVSERNIEALRAAHSAGAEIMLATGRRHDFALPVAQEFGFPLVLVSSNGAVVRSTSGETFSTDFLPRSSALKLIRHMDAFRGHAVLTFDRPGHDALILERFEELNQTISRWLETNRPYIQYVVPLEKAVTHEDPVQAMFCGPVSLMQEAQKRLWQAEFLDEITILRTQYDHRDLTILDILTRNCSKGHALRRWAQDHSIPREQIMAIGDNYNDLEMLEFAGVPVVMGNASQDLKQNGWRVTGSNAENGVAQAIEEIFGLAFRG
ncbi:MAG TPA: Cof-type HAD-IIB family hydrolase, partial [Candidatus Limnocylindrales bacterium]|nr:Cof-type HAD-IIB family hydrolase [Candidatus Limnocylindrales bacterium]